MAQDQASSSEPIEGRIAEVLHDVIRRRLAGEVLSDVDVLKAHPELSPELDRRLTDLRWVEQARHSPKSAYTEEVTATWDGRAPDSIRCHTAELPEIPGFEIKGEIHRGGQGVVFRAVQQSTHREVAVKVVRGGPMGGPREAARFDREVSILARLNHPNIVTVFDSGTTGGHYYYAMRLIEGCTITAFADGRKMTVRDTVQFFVKVCDAVSTAHQLGIIHRDLKPGNILVDAAGEPQVLDFGLAKVVESSGSGDSPETEMTQEGQFMGTLAWAAPEQITEGAAAVDARADQYALGTILYRLLTRKTPYDLTGTAREVMNTIVTAVPRKPRSLRKEIDRELETILLKTLEKSPERRYATVVELASDLRRWLNREPIAACPPGTWYETRKFVQRNRLAVSAASVIFLSLAAGLIGTSLMYVRAESQRRRAVEAEQLQFEEREHAEAARDEAEQVTQFLTRTFGAPDPSNQGKDVTVREVLDRAGPTISEEFADKPLIEARLRAAIGWTYYGLGLYDKGRTHLADAAAIFHRIKGEQDPQTLRVMNALTVAMVEFEDYGNIEVKSSATLEIQHRVLGPEHPDTLQTMHNLAILFNVQGRYAEAEKLHLQTIEIKKRVLGPEHSDTLASMFALANLYVNQGRSAEAEQLHGQALEIKKRVFGPEHPGTLDSMNSLASLYESQGRFAEAEPFSQQTLEIKKRVLGPEHPVTIGSMCNLAILYKNQGRYAEAEPLFSQALKISKRVLGLEHSFTLNLMDGLANLLTDQGRYTEADSLFSQALEITRRVFGPEHPNTLASINNQARLYYSQGRYVEAEPQFRKILEIQKRILGPEHPDTLRSMQNLATLHLKKYCFAEAEQLNGQTLEIQKRVLGPEHPHTLASMSTLANLHQIQGRYAEAELLYTQTLEIEKRVLGPEHPDTLGSMHNLAILYDHQGRHAEAYELHRKTLEIRRRVLGPEHHQVAVTLRDLAKLMEKTQRLAEAEPLCREAQSILASRLPPVHSDRRTNTDLLGTILYGLGRFAEAEPHLTESYEALREEPGVQPREKKEMLERLVRLYESWDAAEPGKGYAEKAAEYRALMETGGEPLKGGS